MLELGSNDGAASGQVMVSVVEGVVEDEHEEAERDGLEHGGEDGILVGAPLVAHIVHAQVHSDGSLRLKTAVNLLSKEGKLTVLVKEVRPEARSEFRATCRNILKFSFSEHFK